MQNNNNEILLSFVIPCYKCEDVLEKCVSSICDQDNCRINFEIILVTDGPEDNDKTITKCRELVGNVADKNDTSNKGVATCKNISLIELDDNIGQAEARNAGIDAAQGEYVTFADSDDYLDDNYFKSISKFLLADNIPDILCWGCTEHHYNAKNKLTKEVEFIPNAGSYDDKKSIVDLAIQLEKQTLFGYLWNKTYKKSLIDKNKLQIPTEHLIEDTLFNIDAFKTADQITTIDKSLYNYTRQTNNGQSLTTSYIPDYFEQYSRRVESLYNWLVNENQLTPANKKILADEYVRFTISAIWRNLSKQSNMTHEQQIDWIKDYYKLQLTKNLLAEANPEGRAANKLCKTLQSKDINKIIRQAKLIDFVNNHFSSLLILLRQSR